MDYSAYLPDELWHEVASHLEFEDQVSLSKTNKQLACIANRLLYKAPKIEKPDHSARLMSMMGTVLEHPELLEWMQSLTIAVTECQVPSMQELKEGKPEEKKLGPGGKDIRQRSPEYKAIREKLMVRLKERGITQETHPAWLGSIQSWSVPAFFGGLLVLLPNLKHLGLSCYEYEQDELRLTKVGWSEMFFSKKGIFPADYNFLQHLQIESLDLSGPCTSLFLTLPHLKYLQLGLHTNDKVLLEKRDFVKNDSPVLNKLLQDLHKMVPDLEVLEIKPSFEWDTAGAMPEITSQLKKLKKLAINGESMLEKYPVK